MNPLLKHFRRVYICYVHIQFQKWIKRNTHNIEKEFFMIMEFQSKRQFLYSEISLSFNARFSHVLQSSEIPFSSHDSFTDPFDICFLPIIC